MIEVQNLPLLKRQIRDVVSDVEFAQKQTRFATAVALTRIANKIREEEKAELPRKLDRPIPFTLRAFRYEKATKVNLRAKVFAGPVQEKYLQYSVQGGTQQVVVPINYKVNRYGNIPGLRRGAVIDRLAAKPDVFVGRPKWGTVLGPAGVWRRVGKYPSQGLLLLMAFENQAEYQADRFPFFEIASRAFDRHYLTEFDAAVDYAFRTAK